MFRVTIDASIEAPLQPVKLCKRIRQTCRATRLNRQNRWHAELHVIGNDFLPCLDWHMTGHAVRLEVIFFADDEAEESLQALGLLDAQRRARW
jgi:hypothetical protein